MQQAYCTIVFRLTQKLGLSLFIATLTYNLSACSDANFASGLQSIETTQENEVDPDLAVLNDPSTFSLITSANQQDGRAGDKFTVSCHYLNSQGSRAEGPETVLKISPALTIHKAATHQFEIQPTLATNYSVRCESVVPDIAQSHPVNLAIVPNAPFSWQVDINNHDCFNERLKLPISVVVVDQYGNTIPNPNTEVQILPAEGVSGDMLNGFQFSQEGYYDITVAVQGELAETNDIAPFHHSILVDETAPNIQISTPSRHESVHLGDNETVEVSVVGEALDNASNINELVVNGIAIEVSGDKLEEPILVAQNSPWGLSIVSGHVKDECGNIGYLAHPFTRSGTFQDHPDTENADTEIRDSLVIKIQQGLLDDGERDSLNDLASILQVRLDALDIDEFVAAGQVLGAQELPKNCGNKNTYVGYTVARQADTGESFTFNAPKLNNLQFIAGGMNLDIEMGRLSFPLHANASAKTCFMFEIDYPEINLDTRVGFDKALIQTTLGLTTTYGVSELDIEEFTVVLEGLDIEVDCGVLDFVCQPLKNDILDQVEQAIMKTLKEKVEGELVDKLEASLNAAKIETDIDLSPPLNGKLTTETKPQNIYLCGEETDFDLPEACYSQEDTDSFGLISLTSSVQPLELGERGQSATTGAIVLGDIDTLPNLTDRDISTAIKLDTLNQLLWSVWAIDALDISRDAFPESIPEAVQDLQMKSNMAPVLMLDNDHGLKLGLGDLEIITKIDIPALMNPEAEDHVPYFIEAHLSVSSILGASIKINADNALEISVNEDSEFHFEIKRLNEKTYTAVISQLLSEQVSGEMPKLINEKLSAMPLPAIDLAQITQVKDAGHLKLINTSLRFEDGYLVAETDVVLAEDPTAEIY